MVVISKSVGHALSGRRLLKMRVAKALTPLRCRSLPQIPKAVLRGRLLQAVAPRASFVEGVPSLLQDSCSGQ